MILQGDCLTELKKLPDCSVQMCVTSPPYYGLRDYGIEGQIGLEETPEMYVQKLVEVFREVKRVLKDDGTLWLNLGSSYASGGRQPSQSLSDVQSYDNDDKESQCSQGDGRACCDSDGEHRGEILSHHVDIAHNDQFVEQGVQQTLQKDRDNEHSNSSQEPLGVLPPCVQESTISSSRQNVRDASVPSTKVLVSPKESDSSSSYVVSSAYNACLNYSRFSQYVKPKDLIPIPWMVAMALQQDGWFLRQDLIWSKPNCMPESVTDRCTKAHEYIFLLAKSQKYYFDNEAIKEDFVDERKGNPGKYNSSYKNLKDPTGKPYGIYQGVGKGWNTDGSKTDRNKRSVWTVTTKPFKEAHFATFPEDLIRPCILAGSKKGDTILDPFFGAGTTGVVAKKLGRRYIGIELNPKYIEISEKRINNTEGMLI